MADEDQPTSGAAHTPHHAAGGGHADEQKAKEAQEARERSEREQNQHRRRLVTVEHPPKADDRAHEARSHREVEQAQPREHAIKHVNPSLNASIVETDEGLKLHAHGKTMLIVSGKAPLMKDHTGRTMVRVVDTENPDIEKLYDFASGQLLSIEDRDPQPVNEHLNVAKPEEYAEKLANTIADKLDDEIRVPAADLSKRTIELITKVGTKEYSEALAGKRLIYLNAVDIDKDDPNKEVKHYKTLELSEEEVAAHAEAARQALAAQVQEVQEKGLAPDKTPHVLPVQARDIHRMAEELGVTTVETGESPSEATPPALDELAQRLKDRVESRVEYVAFGHPPPDVSRDFYEKRMELRESGAVPTPDAIGFQSIYEINIEREARRESIIPLSQISQELQKPYDRIVANHENPADLMPFRLRNLPMNELNALNLGINIEQNVTLPDPNNPGNNITLSLDQAFEANLIALHYWVQMQDVLDNDGNPRFDQYGRRIRVPVPLNPGNPNGGNRIAYLILLNEDGSPRLLPANPLAPDPDERVPDPDAIVARFNYNAQYRNQPQAEQERILEALTTLQFAEMHYRQLRWVYERLAQVAEASESVDQYRDNPAIRELQTSRANFLTDIEPIYNRLNRTFLYKLAFRANLEAFGKQDHGNFFDKIHAAFQDTPGAVSAFCEMERRAAIMCYQTEHHHDANGNLVVDYLRDDNGNLLPRNIGNPAELREAREALGAHYVNDPITGEEYIENPQVLAFNDPDLENPTRLFNRWQRVPFYEQMKRDIQRVAQLRYQPRAVRIAERRIDNDASIPMHLKDEAKAAARAEIQFLVDRNMLVNRTGVDSAETFWRSWGRSAHLDCRGTVGQNGEFETHQVMNPALFANWKDRGYESMRKRLFGFDTQAEVRAHLLMGMSGGSGFHTGMRDYLTYMQGINKARRLALVTDAAGNIDHFRFDGRQALDPQVRATVRNVWQRIINGDLQGLSTQDLIERHLNREEREAFGIYDNAPIATYEDEDEMWDMLDNFDIGDSWTDWAGDLSGAKGVNDMVIDKNKGLVAHPPENRQEARTFFGGMFEAVGSYYGRRPVRPPVLRTAIEGYVQFKNEDNKKEMDLPNWNVRKTDDILDGLKNDNVITREVMDEIEMNVIAGSVRAPNIPFVRERLTTERPSRLPRVARRVFVLWPAKYFVSWAPASAVQGFLGLIGGFFAKLLAVTPKGITPPKSA